MTELTPTELNTAELETQDWDFCRDHLVRVSRSFSKPIGMLEGDLEVGVSCGYLLCRVADTIEDHPSLTLKQRDALYSAFLAVLEDGANAAVFARAFGQAIPETSDENTLARELGRVMRVFRALPPDMQAAIVPWVAEMTRGMTIYSHRRPGPDGFTALTTEADLFRYCYFVAGTVGHMLTDLFVQCLPDLTPDRVRIMRQHAESFGLGLQLVNILKDITDDRARGWSFIPRASVCAQGLTLVNLTDPAHRAAAHAALMPIFDRAFGFLQDAFAYCLAIPPAARAARLFCLLPLWMAVRTLVLARGNDAQFEPGAPVKISRDEVGALLGEVVATCQSDNALRQAWGQLAAR